MGSEQSSSGVGKAQPSARLARGHTIAVPPATKEILAANSDAAPSGNTSPGASVCSDTDLPYISYTLNRPIGDSPKMTGKGQNSANNRRGGFAQRRGAAPRRIPSMGSSSSSTAHSIVVVKEAKSQQSSDKDEDILRLQQIPMFLPIMRGTLGLPGARDPEVLEGVDSGPWLRLGSRYQVHLSACAQLVANEQNIITAKCKEIDAEVLRIHATFVDRQKQGAQLAEKLSHIKQISQHLTRCHIMLEQLTISAEELNQALPPELRLEPFTLSLD